MARGLTVAVWVFCVNVMFTVFKNAKILAPEADYTLGEEMLNTTLQIGEAGTELSFLGVAEIVNALNVFIDLILGPFTLAPQIMSMIGITGLLNNTLTACLWLIYGWFIFQLITGRTMQDVT